MAIAGHNMKELVMPQPDLFPVFVLVPVYILLAIAVVFLIRRNEKLASEHLRIHTPFVVTLSTLNPTMPVIISDKDAK